ncbi:hypothetical protein [Mycolicibacterium setense]
MTPDEVRAAIAAADAYAEQCCERYELTVEAAEARAYTFLKSWLLAQMGGE